MSDNRYNGWTNYETWNLALWLGNDEGSDRYWREQTREAYKNAEKGEKRRADAASTLAEQLKNETEENAPDLGNNFYGDALGAAISQVNWYEIADNWLDDLDTAEIDADEASA